MGTGDGSKTDKGLLNHGGHWRDEREWPLARAKDNTLVSARAWQAVEPRNRQRPRRLAWSQVRSRASRADHRRQYLLGRRNSAARRLGPARRPARLECARADSAFGPQRRAGVSDGAAGRTTWKSPGSWWSSCGHRPRRVDTDFTAKLIDVYPPSADFPGGFDLNIGDGIARARFRDSLQERIADDSRARFIRSRSSSIRRRTSSSAGIAFGSTFRAAISRGSTSIRTRASR